LDIDRPIFSSVNFSATAFVNGLCAPVLQRAASDREERAKRHARTGSTAVSSTEDALDAASKLLDEGTYQRIALDLVDVLENAEASVGNLYEEEEFRLLRTSVLSRSVETREKMQLSRIRHALTGTTDRLRAFEEHVSNAMAAMVGVDQHLQQSNARVLRGKSVSQLLRHFEMFTRIEPSKLETILNYLTKARAEQRKKVTSLWAAGFVSPHDPHYYTYDAKSQRNEQGDEEETSDEVESDSSADEAEDDQEKGTDSNGEGRAGLHRNEVSAIALGLDRLFAARHLTAAQVEWAQKLGILSQKLSQVVGSARNVQQYIQWMLKEFVMDCVHLMECFCEAYEQSPETASHRTYGKALLKTLELVSRLHASLAAADDDSLVTKLLDKQTNDFGVTLQSEYQLKLLPEAPATEDFRSKDAATAMEFFKSTTVSDIERVRNFVNNRITREVYLFEAVFGANSPAIQQLVRRVMDSVIRSFVLQNMTLADLHMKDALAKEGRLSPRSKRRAALRAADAISYSHCMTVELYKLCRSIIEFLKSQIGMDDTEFFDRFVESVFSSRGDYVSKRQELELLKRIYQQLEEFYTRALAAVPDEPFDVRAEHEQKLKDILGHLEDIVPRVVSLANANDIGPYVSDLLDYTSITVAQYLSVELSKVKRVLDGDEGIKKWSEAELAQPNPKESHACALRMILFVQTSIAKVSESFTKMCSPLIREHPSLARRLDCVNSDRFECLEEISEELLNGAARSIVVKSLSILYHLQKKDDFCPTTKRRTDDTTVALPSSSACQMFCRYIRRQLRDAEPFIQLSCGQMPRAAIGTGADQAKESSTDATISARLRQLSLRQMLIGESGPSSFVRAVGVSLYRGISAHLRQHMVNDSGTLIYKQDVAAYKEAVSPLFMTKGLDSAIVERLFTLLKETASLLLIPLDHVKDVKLTGLLQLMDQEEKNDILKSRVDMREYWKSR
jgi:hypothetical protein